MQFLMIYTCRNWISRDGCWKICILQFQFQVKMHLNEHQTIQPNIVIDDTFMRMLTNLQFQFKIDVSAITLYQSYNMSKLVATIRITFTKSN